MFTGIIESLGHVECVTQTNTGLKLEIKFKEKVRGLKLGESIAVDGVCLTATQVSLRGFMAEVVKETLKATTLGWLRPGQWVHLERALKLGDRVGGHVLTGHVNGRGTVTRVGVDGRSKLLWLRVPKVIKREIRPKGSIAINGISLTVQAVSGQEVMMALVPHTLQVTLLNKLKKSSQVNIETDALLQDLREPQKSETDFNIKRRLVFLCQRGF